MHQVQVFNLPEALARCACCRVVAGAQGPPEQTERWLVLAPGQLVVVLARGQLVVLLARGQLAIVLARGQSLARLCRLLLCTERDGLRLRGLEPRHLLRIPRRDDVVDDDAARRRRAAGHVRAARWARAAPREPWHEAALAAKRGATTAERRRMPQQVLAHGTHELGARRDQALALAEHRRRSGAGAGAGCILRCVSIVLGVGAGPRDVRHADACGGNPTPVAPPRRHRPQPAATPPRTRS